MGVEFNEGGNIGRRDFGDNTPKLAGWLIKKGMAKDVNAANRLQVIVSLVFIAIALYLALM
jgi:hypothetical protein